MARQALLPAQVRRVRFHTNPPRHYTASSMTVMQSEFSHDVVSMVVGRMDDDDRVFATGVPVEIEWGLESGDVGKLHGYVHHAEPISVQGMERLVTLKLVCIGASYVMNQEAKRVWRGMTVSAITRQLLDSQKFSGQVQEHKQVWESLVQDGNDWDFLTSLAQRVGWTLYVDDTEVHFRDPLLNLSYQLESAAYFTSRPQAHANAVLVFHAVSGETTPDGGQKSQRLMMGYDPRSGDGVSLWVNPIIDNPLGTQVAKPIFTTYESSPIVNIGEATTTVVGKALANRWHIQAKAEVRGNARVRPGQLVALMGIGERHSGYWYVQSVEHELTGRDYIMHLNLGRDSAFNRFGRPQHRARKQVPLRTTPYGRSIRETPPTLFVNGRWRAAYSPRAYRAG